MRRRAFLGGTLSAATLASAEAQSVPIAPNAVSPTSPGPLVWPVVRKLPPGIRSFAGHTDTVPDIVGRIGTPPSLAIFTEGNHLMALLSDDIVGAFPSWAKSQARFFAKNRGPAMLVRKGNPLGVHALDDIALTRARIALPDATEAGARARYRVAIEGLIGKSGADAVFAAEAASFPGRLGIVHRDLPEMLARGYADVAFTQYHLVSYWTRLFPNHFELVPVSGAEQFFIKIAFARVLDPLRLRALMAFEEFFFSRARDTYPKYDLARMSDDEFGATVGLD